MATQRCFQKRENRESLFCSLRKASHQGFTLIELSIVLMIIGLIVGGVLVGQELIRTAEVRSMISEKDKISTAIFTFKDKYAYLPGDFPDASSVLGGSWNSGDGNGSIDDQCSAAVKPAPYDSWPYTIESYNLWDNLSRAGMIWGLSPGVGGGYPFPPSSYGHGVGYTFLNNFGGCALIPSYTYGQTWTNFFMVSAGTYISPMYLGPGMVSEDAYNVDRKIDDGLPASGNVQVLGPASGAWWIPGSVPSSACATTQVPSTSVYDLTVKTRTCLMFWFNMIPQ